MLRFLFVCLSFIAVSVHAKSLDLEIDALIQEALPHAYVGVYIEDPESGKVIYARNADHFFSLASGTKLFTAAASLYQLGEQYRYQTMLLQDNNTIYIRFTGSPGLTTKNLRQLLGHLKKTYGSTIDGNIVIDATQFQPPWHAAGDAYEDLGWYYAAPSSAVILNKNAVAYRFISAKELGAPIQLQEQSTDKVLTVINQVKTVSKEEEKEHCGLNIQIQPENTLRLYGCITQTEKPTIMRLAIPDPVLFAKQMVHTILAENGIQHKGDILTGKTPPQAHVIASLASRPLHAIIRHMLLYSDNLYAASLTKLLAFTLTGNGSFKDGAFAIKTILQKNTGLQDSTFVLTDGIGTRFNLFTPKQVVTLLASLYQDKKKYPIFLQTLSRMGMSGSLESRMKNTKLQGRVYAKTGTMHDISSLSGYFLLTNGKPLIFSIIINNITDGVSAAKKVEDTILLILDDVASA